MVLSGNAGICFNMIFSSLVRCGSGPDSKINSIAPVKSILDRVPSAWSVSGSFIPERFSSWSSLIGASASWPDRLPGDENLDSGPINTALEGRGNRWDRSPVRFCLPG